MKGRLRDLIGKKVALTRTLTTNGGDVFPEGTVMLIDSTWRGKFMLSTVGTEFPNNRSIRKCSRFDFHLLETP